MTLYIQWMITKWHACMYGKWQSCVIPRMFYIIGRSTHCWTLPIQRQSLVLLSSLSPSSILTIWTSSYTLFFWASSWIQWRLWDSKSMCILSKLDLPTNKFVALVQENQKLLDDFRQMSIKKTQQDEEHSKQVQQLEAIMLSLRQKGSTSQSFLKEPKISLPTKFDAIVSVSRIIKPGMSCMSCRVTRLTRILTKFHVSVQWGWDGLTISHLELEEHTITSIPRK